MQPDSITQALALLFVQHGVSAPLAALLAIFALLGAVVLVASALVWAGEAWQRRFGRRSGRRSPWQRRAARRAVARLIL